MKTLIYIAGIVLLCNILHAAINDNFHAFLGWATAFVYLINYKNERNKNGS